jgi:hypothetical protein
MPNVQSGVYPSANDVMDLARAMINDMLRSTRGSILTNTAPFTAVYLNSGIRKTQRYLANNGMPSQIKDGVVITLTPAATSDPSVQMFVSSTGYFNGSVILAQPVLPSDMILPLRLWERQNGSNGDFIAMEPAKNGLPSQQPGQYFGSWEWRDDNINLPGCVNTQDLRLRYEQSLATISPTADFANTLIPIRDGHEALALAVVYRRAVAVGAPQRTEIDAEWKSECDMLISRQSRKDEQTVFRPGGYRAGDGDIDGSLAGTSR